ncbi:hypothetical protein AcW1_006516 [Taiwanofungus camphoratus]|nr:hypothetical protein AcV5_009103 [Antrodia cinnamomea]KAI0924389.1 hypothetical protein AcW2_005277 [Antrodia cinnamomea]KAI0954718.1 hypothetical protein AcW1_006516 [Antrodia cinnamomea]
MAEASMQSIPRAQLSFGNHPFNKPNADVILASSDHIIFRVHRTILCEASSVFEGMFLLPQPARVGQSHHLTDAIANELDGLPVIRVSENSQTLENLLRLLYPISDPILTDLSDVQATLDAAVKYEMDEAKGILKSQLHGFVSIAPLVVYTVACRHMFEDIALQAAKAIFSQDLVAQYVPELATITAGAYLRLLQYCQAQWNGKVDTTFVFCSPPSKASILNGPGMAFSPATCDIFNFSDADIILRTSDHILFRIHKVIVDLASPDLTLQKLPHISDGSQWSAEESQGHLPVMQLEENSHTLSILLQILYPHSDPELTDLEDILLLLSAAERYNMKKTMQLLMTKLMATEIEPLRMYYIAVRLNLSTHAAEAAKRTLQLHGDKLSMYYPEAEGVSAKAYFRLLRYHEECRKRACLLTYNYKRMLYPWTSRFHEKCPRQRLTHFADARYSLTCWYNSYIDIFRELLETGQSYLSMATAIATLEATVKACHVKAPCAFCYSPEGTLLLMEFSQFFAEEVKRVVYEVALDLSDAKDACA